MPVLSCGVHYDGKPLLEVLLQVSSEEAAARREDGILVPPGLPLIALLDTGAKSSQVQLKHVQTLAISRASEVDMFTASTGSEPIRMPVYAVDISLRGDRPGPIALNIPVIGSDKLSGLGIDMLLGRDVLRTCLLSYDGPNDRFSLAYDIAKSD